jgi:hypothetical protein
MLVFLVLTSLALADPSSPRGCTSPSREAVAEIARLFRSAGEHASMYHLCSDGDDEEVTVQVLSACEAQPAIRVRYRVVTRRQRGGECSPYPQCAEAPPPEEGIHSVSLERASGMLVVPRKLPGIALKTPLGKAHSAGCKGKKAAFVPRKIEP